MTEHISIEFQGLERAMDGVTVADVAIHRGLYDLLDDLRKRGEHYIRLYAPAHHGDLMRRVSSTAPMPSPEGLEAVAGVRQGDKVPLYVHGGTGIYKGGRLGGRLPAPDGLKIRTKRGGPLTFQKANEERKFKMFVRGQKANPFVLYAFQQLVPYARGRIRRFDITRGRG